jgi:hypothetical protein
LVIGDDSLREMATVKQVRKPGSAGGIELIQGLNANFHRVIPLFGKPLRKESMTGTAAWFSLDSALSACRSRSGWLGQS